MPSKLHPLEVPDFVASSAIAIVYAGALAPSNERVFEAFAHENAASCWVNTNDVLYEWARPWINKRQRALGWPEVDRIHHGYYLFLGGEVWAFQPGAFQSGIVDIVSYGIAAALYKSMGKAFELVRAQAEDQVISVFVSLIALWKTYATSPDSEISQQFSVLGLQEHCTRAELAQRRNDLVKEWHPDQFAQDPVAFAQANERLAQVNAAYSLILERKGWK